MSRFSEDYDERWPNELMMLNWNREQALKGKRGKKALQELKAILSSMPSKRLIEGTLLKDGDVCLAGAYIVAKDAPIPALVDPEEDVEGQNYYATIDAGEKAGLAKPFVEQLAWMNDGEWEGYSPERRYERALEWIESELATA